MGPGGTNLSWGRGRVRYGKNKGFLEVKFTVEVSFPLTKEFMTQLFLIHSGGGEDPPNS